MFRIFSSKCAFCKRKSSLYRHYKDPKGKKVKLCLECSVYAESVVSFWLSN